MGRPPRGPQTSLQREHCEAQMSCLGAVVCTTASGRLDCFSHRASRVPGVVLVVENSWFGMLRPYHPEHTPSRPIREVKLDWASISTRLSDRPGTLSAVVSFVFKLACCVCIVCSVSCFMLACCICTVCSVSCLHACLLHLHIVQSTKN